MHLVLSSKFDVDGELGAEPGFLQAATCAWMLGRVFESLPGKGYPDACLNLHQVFWLELC
jgi:hypothetical protein